MNATQSAHTPGPWTVEPGNGELDGRARFPTSHKVLVFANGDCGTHPVADCSGNATCRVEWEQEANARLIAAAPELLAALRGVISVADRQTDEFIRARTAIAKATGEIL